MFICYQYILLRFLESYKVWHEIIFLIIYFVINSLLIFSIHWLIVDSPIQLLRCEKSPYFASAADEYMCFFRYSYFKAPHILLFSPSTKKGYLMCDLRLYLVFLTYIKAVTGFKNKLDSTLNLLAYQSELTLLTWCSNVFPIYFMWNAALHHV